MKLGHAEGKDYEEEKAKREKFARIIRSGWRQEIIFVTLSGDVPSVQVEHPLF